MNTFVVLMSVTLVGVAALFIALALFVRAIVHELEEIGGPATRFVRPVNYLSKIRLGLRAIEVETAYIAPQVTQLNQTLTSIRVIASSSPLSTRARVWRASCCRTA